MLRPTYSLSLMTLLTVTSLVACTADKNETDTDAGTGATTSATATATDPTDATSTGSATDPTGSATGSATETTPTTTMTNDTEADGAVCTANDDCMSLGCLKFRDVEEGECVAAPADNATRITGTLIDFTTGATVPSLELRVVGALSALSDPANATPVAKGNADADGKVDFVSPDALKEGIAIIGIASGGDYYTTATGLASQTAGKYGPMSGVRDIWLVPSATLTTWSGLLATDPDVLAAEMAMPDKPLLPLGVNGGVIGLARDAKTAAPKAGTKVVPVKADSAALVRYLSEDGLSFTSDMTSANGIFILLNPGFAEEFTVEGFPEIVSKAGSAKGAAFITVFNLP